MPAEAPLFATPYRTHTCGALRGEDAGTTARLAGWVHRRRDYGKLTFIDLRDRHGITQVVIDAGDAPEASESAARLRPEFVVAFEGEVALRQPGTENPKLPTGAIELQARTVRILNEAKTPPFYVNDPDAPIDETLRLRYRYLDIRRDAMQRRLLLRSRLVQAIREVHHANGFVEVETPNLIKSTPEGARDFIVPSRLQPGTVYALPQSPQQLKQLLMVAGIDRYFQIARCFRDEDLRGDRQPEFTQLDLEMSFVDEATVMGFVEQMVIDVTRATVPERPIREVPFPVLEYGEAMERFGSDKPDIRFAMELFDLAPALAGTRWRAGVGVPRVRRDARRRGSGQGHRRAGDGRRDAAGDRRPDRARQAVRRPRARPPRGGRGRRAQRARRQVPRTRDAGGDPRGGRGRTRRPDPGRRGHGGHRQRRARPLRVELGGRLGLADPDELAYLWVHRFPMYKWDAEQHRWDATHNPFSGVVPEEEALLTTVSGSLDDRSPDDPAGRAHAMQYDIVLNGWELGGGSIRIWQRDLLARSFNLQGYTLDQMKERFGAMLEAFEFGAPPHGGIALGIDRWAALFSHQTNIREVMAFPKTQSGTDPMLEAPSAPEPEQYAELGLRFVGVPGRS